MPRSCATGSTDPNGSTELAQRRAKSTRNRKLDQLRRGAQARRKRSTVACTCSSMSCALIDCVQPHRRRACISPLSNEKNCDAARGMSGISSCPASTSFSQELLETLAHAQRTRFPEQLRKLGRCAAARGQQAMQRDRFGAGDESEERARDRFELAAHRSARCRRRTERPAPDPGNAHGSPRRTAFPCP